MPSCAPPSGLRGESAAGSAQQPPQRRREVLPRREAKRQEEGREAEPPPEPSAWPRSRPAPKNRAEDLTGQGNEERNTQRDRGTYAIGHPPRTPQQKSQIRATGLAPIVRPLALRLT